MCSVNFPNGKPTSSNQDPTLFITIQDNREKEKKYLQLQRQKSPRKKPIFSKVTTSSKRLVLRDDKGMHDNEIKERSNLAPIPLACKRFTREYDANFYTGFSTTTSLFKTVFNRVAAKARVITYWEG